MQVCQLQLQYSAPTLTCERWIIFPSVFFIVGLRWSLLWYHLMLSRRTWKGKCFISKGHTILYILVAIKFLNAVLSLCDSHWRIFSGLDLHLYHILCQLVVCWLNLIYWEQGIHPSEALNEYQTKPFLPLQSARCASIFVVIHKPYNSHLV